MIFKELVLQNFGPYANRHVINLNPEINENTRPIILFGGMNGGGKTTLMDAIRLALYGQRAHCSTRGNLGYSEFLTQAVNNQASSIEQTRIELAFEHIINDQWKEFRIVRSWTKNPKDGKDNLGILDTDWPDPALANTWDEYIETILPLGISNLFLFDGEQVKELAEQETPPQAVIEAIQSLLGLELAERLSIDLDILASRKRKALASASQLSNLEEIEARLKQYNQEKELAQAALGTLQQQLKEAQKNYQEAADKFRTEGGRIAAQRSQLESKLDELAKATDNQRQEMCDLASDLLPLGLVTPLLKRAKLQAETEAKILQAKVARDVIQQRDDRLLEYLDKLSLTSKQLEKIKLFLQEENRSLNQELDLNKEPWLCIDEEGIKLLENLLEHQLSMQIDLASKQIERLKQLEEELDSTERQLAVAASPEDYQKLDQLVKEAQKELIKCQAAYEAGKHKYEEAIKAIDKIKKELEKYSEQAIDRANDEHIIKSVAKVQKTLQLFRERLTLKKLNKLEGEVTECFRYLLHKSDLVHRVAIDTNNFSLSLYDLQGLPVPKHRLSAGEKQLLAIAFLWGLARVSGRNLPVAIDTPLGRLDSSHRSNLVERYFPTASHQVILLSTDTEIGKVEVEQLREQGAIAREYLLKYDSQKRQTVVKTGYFY
ncbi:MAG: DNA sulfur modification protein DndD [Hydrococcus sp. C42_A2020_068]|nr:DNA sulfur modification protein DndD [Hydrococcus sp. C42_A2020_068]